MSARPEAVRFSSGAPAAAALAGLVHGLLYTYAGYRAPWIAAGTPSTTLVEGLFVLLMLPLVLLVLHEKLQQQAQRHTAPGPGRERFLRLQPWSYLLVALGGLSTQPSFALTMALCVTVLALQVGILAVCLGRAGRDSVVRSERWVPLLFMVSGFSALIYQVVWQRVLFSTFGVNSEAVTIVVSVFMFGIGVGALLGGYLQHRFPSQLLRIFLVLELGIGLFGLASIDLIALAGSTGSSGSNLALALRVYAVLAIPTLLMGATLPVLVAFLQGYYRNIGKTIGQLYALNTIGSAIAAFATVCIIFVLVGQRSAVIVAALCNLATALLIFDAARRQGPARAVAPSEEAAQPASGPGLPYPIVFAMLALVGFISLSHEILWYRMLGFMSGSKPQVFGLLLAAFLLGIAAGSLRAKPVCEGSQPAGPYLVRCLLAATLCFYFAGPVIAQLSSWFGSAVGLMAGYAAAGVVAFLCGGLLPVLIHIGTARQHAGSTLQVSWLYFANVIGATTGPLITGFWLLDRYSLRDSIALMTALGLLVCALLAGWLALSGSRPGRARVLLPAGAAAALAVAFAGWVVHAVLYDGYLEKLQSVRTGVGPFRHVVENRSGILTVDAADDDVMYGSGAYDGRFNLDPVGNSNGIDRAYMIAGLHPAPRQVLEIGLSTGSWTRVMSRYTPVQEMTVVEINKGYPSVAAAYPQIAGIFGDPRITMVFDDGRRWLRNNPERKFDMIVMNTTLHWRSNATNLLSREFLELVRAHLKPGGVVYYNATGSRDVTFTAAHVFKHVTTMASFVAASDLPFDLPLAERRRNLLAFKLENGAPVFEQSDAHRASLKRLATLALPDVHDTLLQESGLQVITDDNMAVEYK